MIEVPGTFRVAASLEGVELLIDLGNKRLKGVNGRILLGRLVLSSIEGVSAEIEATEVIAIHFQLDGPEPVKIMLRLEDLAYVLEGLHLAEGLKEGSG